MAAVKPGSEKAAVAYLRASGFLMEVSIRSSSPEGKCATTSMIASKEFLVSVGLESL